jgi:hypothetical protein
MIEAGKSYEYRSEALHIIYVVLGGDAKEGWETLILFNDHAKRLGGVVTAGDVDFFGPDAIIPHESHEVGSLPVERVR